MTRHTLSVLVALLIALAGPRAARGEVQPAVATDRADYSPGSTVSISGAGFQPGEAVRLQVLQISTTDNGGNEHKPWQVAADAKGALSASWFVTSHEAGATLRLTAAGLISGRNAQVVFTDASVNPASGGGAIAADTAGGAFTPLTGPEITETVIGDISLGTLVLTAPAGFVFDTNAPLPFITLTGDNNNKNINLLTNGSTIALTVTTNTLSFTVTSKSKGQTKNSLAYSNIRVRPSAATPLASGNITNTGTSIFPNSTANFGTLTEVAGTRTQLVVSGFPNPQIAGVPGSVTVAAQDQFGNPALGYTGTVHFTSSDARAALPADYTFVSGDNGSHTFSAGVTLNTIGTQSITASNLALASFIGTQSGILVNPAPADRLVFSTQPGSATYGSLLTPQPMVVSQDAFGNNSTVGLGVSKLVTVTLSSGTGLLLGTASVDIGTGAGNGVANFANLTVNAVGAGKQLTASAAGLNTALSGAFSILPATVTANVTVNGKVYDATTGATIATRSLTGALGGDNVTLIGGSASFATKTVANAKTVTVSGLSLTGTAAANYLLASTTVTTTASITPATLTGTAGNQTRLYGQVNPAFTITYTGFVSGEDASLLTGTLSFSTAAGTNSPVGNYPITPSGQSAPNYAIQDVAGTLTVTPAPLLAKAHNASREYGQRNPDFTATITGFVNGEDTNVLGGTLTLTTTAQTNSLPSDYPIVPGGLLSVNYSITFSNGTLTITSTNQAPVLAFITNAIVRPDELLLFKVVASDSDGDQLNFTLDPGAPAGAVVTNLAVGLPPTATNTFFLWSPTRAQASTTNSITLRVTDNGGPPMSATQTFTVVVLDYLEIAIGSTNVQSGDSAAVPINLASSDGVTNLQFSLDWPAGYLSNAALTVTAPAVANASLQDNGANLVLSFQTAPGQVLQGTQQLAQLSFEAVSNQFSAFVPVTVRNPSGAKPNGAAYDNYVTPASLIAVIEGEPLLLPWMGQNSARYLNLYGRLGVAYQLQYSANVKTPAPWTPAWNYVQTNGIITFGVDSLPPTVFYRIFRP